MAISFTKFPFVSLILRWQLKLDSVTSQAYVDLVKMLDEKETKLTLELNKLSNGVDGSFITADAKTVTVKNGIITSII